MSELNLFETASRHRYTFDTPKGQLDVSDLWTLPLSSAKSVSLNSVAVALHQELEEMGQVSFVSSNRPANNVRRVLNQKLDIVKRIIEVREEENATARAATEKAALKEQLLEALEAKRKDNVSNLTEEEILAKLADIDG